MMSRAWLRQYPDNLAIVSYLQSKRKSPATAAAAAALREVEIVKRIACTVAGGQWYSEIILVLCYGMTIADLAVAEADRRDLKRAIHLFVWFSYWCHPLICAIDVFADSFTGDPLTPSPWHSCNICGDDADQSDDND